MISLDDIRDAERRIAPVVRVTPLDTSSTFTDMAGRPVLLKCEHLQRTGSFKVRGAYNLISRLPPGAEVVAASAGNHGQGVALAAGLCGHKATVFMPVTAALPKVAATRGYGAEVRLVGAAVDDTITAARAWAAARGATFVPPFDDPLIVAGQGTVGLELAAQAPEGATVVVPVGGGGLVSGVAVALAATRPDVAVVGVQAVGAASMVLSLDAGECVTLERAVTMADGIALRCPSPLTLAHVQAHVREIVTVAEDEISRAVLLLLERAKAVVEPAGAVGLAAVLSGKVSGDGPVVAVLSGGNVDPMLLMRLVEQGLSAAGRFLVLRVALDDRPGSLAVLTAAIAAMGLNVISVEHHRAGLPLPHDRVEVTLVVETFDPSHAVTVVDRLRSDGFEVRV